MGQQRSSSRRASRYPVCPSQRKPGHIARYAVTRDATCSTFISIPIRGRQHITFFFFSTAWIRRHTVSRMSKLPRGGTSKRVKRRYRARAPETTPRGGGVYPGKRQIARRSRGMRSRENRPRRESNRQRERARARALTHLPPSFRQFVKANVDDASFSLPFFSPSLSLVRVLTLSLSFLPQLAAYTHSRTRFHPLSSLSLSL